MIGWHRLGGIDCGHIGAVWADQCSPSGNVATETVSYMLHGMGVETGVDMSKLLDAVSFIFGALGRLPASNVYRALRDV